MKDDTVNARQWKMLVDLMEEDEAKEVVARCCEGIQKIAEEMGPSVLEPSMQRICACLLALLQEKAPCQMLEDDEEEEEEAIDHDHVLMDFVADLVGAMAKVWGSVFNPFFQPMFPAVLRFSQGSRPSTDRSMAIGAVAEVLDEIDAAAAEYVAPMVPVVMKGLADSDPNVRASGPT